MLTVFWWLDAEKGIHWWRGYPWKRPRQEWSICFCAFLNLPCLHRGFGDGAVLINCRPQTTGPQVSGHRAVVLGCVYRIGITNLGRTENHLKAHSSVPSTRSTGPESNQAEIGIPNTVSSEPQILGYKGSETLLQAQTSSFSRAAFSTPDQGRKVSPLTSVDSPVHAEGIRALYKLPGAGGFLGFRRVGMKIWVFFPGWSARSRVWRN